MAELSDSELWRAVDATVHDVLLPAIPDDQPWARAVAVQLVGLARYAASRPPAQSEERVAELADVLASLATNEIVAEHWSGDRSTTAVMAAVGLSLAAAVNRSDASALEVRSVLRPIAVRQLDEELAVTGALVDAFRGRLDG